MIGLLILFSLFTILNSFLMIFFYLKYRELQIVFVRLFTKVPELMELLREKPNDDCHDESLGYI